MTHVVCVMPTRGLVFARTLASLRQNKITSPIIVDGLPLPHSHNEAVRQGLLTTATHLLIVEDDVELPEGAVKAMLAASKPVVALNYPILADGKTGAVTYRKGKMRHVSLGCTLIEREVFEIMPEPWFQNDKTLNARTWRPLNAPAKYGGHDIWFCYKLTQLGIEFIELKGMQAKHLRCQELNRIQENRGCYTIEPLPNIEGDYGENN